jgi:hypothetical protein
MCGSGWSSPSAADSGVLTANSRFPSTGSGQALTRAFGPIRNDKTFLGGVRGGLLAKCKGRPRKPLAEVLLGAPRCAPLRLGST